MFVITLTIFMWGNPEPKPTMYIDRPIDSCSVEDVKAFKATKRPDSMYKYIKTTCRKIK